MKMKNPIPLGDSRERGGGDLPTQATWHRTGIHWKAEQSAIFTSCCTDCQRSNLHQAIFCLCFFFDFAFSHLCFVTLWVAGNKGSVLHVGEVREDWKALRSRRGGEKLQGYWSNMGVFEGTTAVGGWQGGGGWVDKREVGEITGFLPTPCSSASFPVPVLSKRGNKGLWKHPSKRCMIVLYVWLCFTHMQTPVQMYMSARKAMSKWVHVCIYRYIYRHVQFY